jgi:hypothetical protein
MATPILIAENDKAIQGFAAGTYFKDVNLGPQIHPILKCKYSLCSFWQRIHLSISEKKLRFSASIAKPEQNLCDVVEFQKSSTEKNSVCDILF